MRDHIHPHLTLRQLASEFWWELQPILPAAAPFLAVTAVIVIAVLL